MPVIPGVSRDLMYIAVVTHSMPRVEFHTKPYELQGFDESDIVTPSLLSGTLVIPIVCGILHVLLLVSLR
jgi:hypothetical protein